MKLRIEGNTTAVANALGSVLNPEGVLLHIYDAFLYVEVQAAGAATLDLGINATINTDDTDLASAIAMNAGLGTVIKIVGTDLASEGAAVSPRGVLWAAGSYLVAFNPAAVASTLFRADLYLHYIRLA
jgi:hypothetical protein